jgi:Tol biopolymer transport system component
MNADGSGQIRLTDNVAEYPAWSPDGRAFAFLSNRDGEWGVYTWRLSDHATTKRFTIGPTLPNWQQAGLDWGP